MTDKKADLAGPGIGDYKELAAALPKNYHPLIPPKERMAAVFALKNYIEENLCRALLGSIFVSFRRFFRGF